MKKNFTIMDGVVFSFSGESVDMRGECELVGVLYSPGVSPRVKFEWRLEGSNRAIMVEFRDVEDFQIKGRDGEYPHSSSGSLAIAGFVDSKSYSPHGDFCVEPHSDADYMSFAMDDMSAFLVKAGIADMRRV